MDKTKILEIAEDIRGNQRTKEEHFNMHPDFAEKYPVLFDSLCNPDMDMKMFYYMLDMMDKVQSNKQTQHNASVDVGQKLFNKYVDPILPYAEKKKNAKNDLAGMINIRNPNDLP